jgi:hypothetical protein
LAGAGVEGARKAARDADEERRAFIREHLDELEAAKEHDGRAAAERIKTAAENLPPRAASCAASRPRSASSSTRSAGCSSGTCRSRAATNSQPPPAACSARAARWGRVMLFDPREPRHLQQAARRVFA